jgi:flavin reductase (DIM6/NTAB) family NADH-FMN oxidoreductase RutF
MTDVAAEVFRQLCGRFATGVTVVTAVAEDGRPVGMTANSFTSVSLDPPLVSVNIDHQADMHRHLARAERFAINVLESRQEALSQRFAEELADRFDGVGYRRSELGLPLLDHVLATIECLVHARFEVGDHTIVVGRVIGGSTAKGRPLFYYRGGYFDSPPR